MGVYHLSYDVGGEDNGEALVLLIRALRKKLLATNVIRPVQSTIRFSTERDYASVCAVVSHWAEEKSISYFFSKVEPSANPGKFYYWMRESSELKAGIDEMVKSIDEED